MNRRALPKAGVGSEAKGGAGVDRRTVLAGSTAISVGARAAGISAGQTTAIPRSKSVLQAPAGKIPVAFLMDADVTMIDFAGPWEVFQDAFETQRFSLFTVASAIRQLQTTGNVDGDGADMKMSGMRFTPDYTYDTAPQPKVVVIPAQAGGRSADKLAWIRAVAGNADVIMSVCTGAFVLANTGLLDGLSATTHHGAFDSFERQFPKVKLVRGRRFIDNGKFITAGGLTSGIDAAIHVVERYFG